MLIPQTLTTVDCMQDADRSLGSHVPPAQRRGDASPDGRG